MNVTNNYKYNIIHHLTYIKNAIIMNCKAITGNRANSVKPVNCLPTNSISCFADIYMFCIDILYFEVYSVFCKSYFYFQ